MRRCISILSWLVVCAGILAGQSVDIYQRPLQAEPSRDYDVHHYLVKLSLDLSERSFQGETTVILSPLCDGFDRCILDAESFTVSSVRDNWGVPLEFEQNETQLIIHWDRTFEYGEILSFTVEYAGQDPKGGLRFYPETEDNPALVASDSWPYGVHHWFPCNDYPHDKATNEIVVTVKEPLKAVSNGRLVAVSRDRTRGTSTWHWKQDKPHSTYLMVLAAAPYVVARDSYGTLPIHYWVYPRYEAQAELVFGKTPKMVEFFNRIYGYDYPWDKYDQVLVPFGGGAESTSATVMGHRIMYDERGEQDFSSIGIVSHELAHQWWGDLITLRSWEHAWMNESFATYSDYLYVAYERGEDEGAYNLWRKKNSYLREARTRYMRPIVFSRYNRPEELFDAHSYPKGAVVLHMLRYLLGDDAFFRTLSYFLHQHAFQPVDTHDFMKAVKEVTGRNLDWFFQQWVFSPGHPVFDIRYTWNPAAKKIDITIKQVQDTSKGIPVFKTPVEVAVTASGEKSVHRLWLDEPEETFELPCREAPRLVRFDEGNHLLKEWTFSKTPQELIYQLQHDDVIGRMWAASELERYVSDTEVEARLRQSVLEDAFWAVRKAAVEVLGRTRKEDVVSLLKRACRDSRSEVRTAALEALGEWRRSDFKEFFKKRFEEDDSYLAQAAALRALGKTGDVALIPFLRQAEKMPSPRHVLRRAAREAVEALTGKDR